MDTISYSIDYRLNNADACSIEKHLLACDNFFMPPLSSYVNILKYSKKLYENAENFEAWHGENLIGLVSVYLNDLKSMLAYISNVSVDVSYQSQGIAKILLSKAIVHGTEAGFHCIKLDVYRVNTRAINLYNRLGFEAETPVGEKMTMVKYLL